MFKLNKRSLLKLEGVHSDLILVVKRAIEISSVDFAVTEGLRTPDKQMVLYRAGASKTLNSRHITGHAVDVAAWVAGQIRWDWPLYSQISVAFKKAADDLKVSIVWGGDWCSFKDGPHFELSRNKYP